MSAPAPSPLAIVDAEPLPRQDEVLTEAALAFVAELHRRFAPAAPSSSPDAASGAPRSPGPPPSTSSRTPHRSARETGRSRLPRPR